MYDCRTVGTLSPHCFWPAPKVASAIAGMVRREKPLTADFDALAEFTHRLFAARRKQLGSIMGRDTAWPHGIQPQQRPETLSVEQIEALRALNPT